MAHWGCELLARKGLGIIDTTINKLAGANVGRNIREISTSPLVANCYLNAKAILESHARGFGERETCEPRDSW